MLIAFWKYTRIVSREGAGFIHIPNAKPLPTENTVTPHLGVSRQVVTRVRQDGQVTTSSAPTKSWLALWLTLTTIWGFSFFFIKVASSFLDPSEQTFGRMGFGALALIIIVLVTKRKFIVRGPAIKHLALITLMAQVIPFAIFAWAIHHISSIAAGLLNSTMPLWTAILAVLMLPEEKLNPFRVGGLLLGFLGLLVLLGVWDVNFQANWLAYTACALCTIGYAFSAIWTRKYVTPLGLDLKLLLGQLLESWQ
ncbi:MAG: EamA family transporter [Actinobacteria bacterium]|nr:EamA family transporter [Actinomycetota bacterium]